MYYINNLPKNIIIGKQGESGVTTLQIDCTAWLTLWPNGTIGVTFMHPKTEDVSIVPPAQAVVTNNILNISVLHNMTETAGSGSINIRIVDGDNIEKRSAVVVAFIEEGHPHLAGASFNMMTDLVNEVTEKMNEVENGASGASIVSAAFVNDDIVFTKDDATLVPLVGAKTILTGDQGPIGVGVHIGTTEPAVDAIWIDTSEADFLTEFQAIQDATVAANTAAQDALGGIIVSAAFNANDMRFTKADNSVIDLVNAKNVLTGPQGIQGETGNNATVATDVFWDAAGDLAVGTGSNASARLAIGTAGKVLKVNSGATGLEWGTDIDTTYPAASTSEAGLAPQATAPASGLRNVLAIENGETAYTNKALFDATAPSTQALDDTAVVGTAMVASRRDHKHVMPTTANIMTAIQTVDGATSGLDADLLDGNHAAAFAVAAHAHGNLTTDGKVGTVTDLPLMTGTDGLVVAKTMAEAIAIWKFTNPNLLHNWDFRFNPVNQRGASGDISGTYQYFYDRWYGVLGTITINSGYLSIPDAAAIEQRIEGNALSGKVVTASVMIGDVVYSGTGTFPTSAGWVDVNIAGYGIAGMAYATGYMYIYFYAQTSTRQVQAVKLELGTVSTLAYDPPMEYGPELLKCQRYFRTLSAGGGIPQFLSASVCILSFPLSPYMRTLPTVSIISLTDALICQNIASYTPTSYASNYSSNQIYRIQFAGTFTNAISTITTNVSAFLSSDL